MRLLFNTQLRVYRNLSKLRDVAILLLYIYSSSCRSLNTAQLTAYNTKLEGYKSGTEFWKNLETLIID